MSEIKKYDLEDRTLKFSKDIFRNLKTIPRDIISNEYIKQITRSSGSIGANYIEANEALSKKDFLMRMKISRKEAKETVYWLNIISDIDENTKIKLQPLLQEAIELKKIFSAIIEKSQ